MTERIGTTQPVSFGGFRFAHGSHVLSVLLTRAFHSPFKKTPPVLAAILIVLGFFATLAQPPEATAPPSPQVLPPDRPLSSTPPSFPSELGVDSHGKVSGPSTSDASTDGDSAERQSERVYEVGPGLVWLPDKQGGYLPLPGWSYEDIARLLQGESKTSPGLPSPVLLGIEGEGACRDLFVDWRLVYEIDQLRDGAEVDLGLADCQIETSESSPIVEGDAAAVSVVARKDGGYTARFSGVRATRVKLTIACSSPCMRYGVRRELQLLIPPSLASGLHVKAPYQRGTANLQGAGVLTESDGNTDTLTLRGVSGLSRLSWNEPTDDSPLSFLEVNSSVVVHALPEQFRVEAALALSKSSGFLSNTTFHLPSDAREISAKESRDYLLRPVRLDQDVELKEPEGPSERSEYTTWQIVPLKPNLSACKVEVAYMLPAPDPINEHGDEGRATGALVSIPDARSHTGQIYVTSSDDWTVNVVASPGLNRLYTMPEGAPPGASFRSAWRFLGENYQFVVRRTRRPPRIVVVPRFNCTMLPSRAELEATYRFQITGRAVDNLTLECHGWRIREAAWETAGEEHGVVDINADGASATATLGTPTMGTVSLRLTAEREWPVDSTSQDWQWPMPSSGQIQNAVAEITSADDVDFTFRPAASRGHSPVESDSLASTQVFSLAQRDGRFAFTAAQRPRAAVASQVLQVVLQDELAAVSLELSVDAQYETPNHLEFSLPRDIENVSAFWGDVKATQLVSEGAPRDTTRWRIEKPAAAAASRQIRLQWDAPQSVSRENGKANAQSNTLFLPEWVNMEMRATRAQIYSSRRGAMADASLITAGEAIAAHGNSDDDQVRLVTLEPCAALKWTSSDQSRDVQRVMRVARAFLQTWITQDACQQYAAIVVETNESGIRVRFPSTASLSSVGVRVRPHGAKTTRILTASSLTAERGGLFYLPLADKKLQEPTRYTVETTFRVASPPTSRSFRLEPAISLPEVWIDQMVWQIAYPRSMVCMFYGEEWSRGNNLLKSLGAVSERPEDALRRWTFCADWETSGENSSEGPFWNPGTPSDSVPKIYLTRSGELTHASLELASYGRACLFPSLLLLIGFMAFWLAPGRWSWGVTALVAASAILLAQNRPLSLGQFLQLGWPGAAAALMWRLASAWFVTRPNANEWQDAVSSPLSNRRVPLASSDPNALDITSITSPQSSAGGRA